MKRILFLSPQENFEVASNTRVVFSKRRLNTEQCCPRNFDLTAIKISLRIREIGNIMFF